MAFDYGDNESIPIASIWWISLFSSGDSVPLTVSAVICRRQLLSLYKHRIVWLFSQ